MVGKSFIPEGTVIGMSPYVVNRHKKTFGEDAGSWNPDRWMVDAEKRRVLEGSVLTVLAHLSECRILANQIV
jgi:cytochrome P450